MIDYRPSVRGARILNDRERVQEAFVGLFMLCLGLAVMYGSVALAIVTIKDAQWRLLVPAFVLLAGAVFALDHARAAVVEFLQDRDIERTA